ncbi:NmrA family NAD(P)-binding protein [Streptomyces acidicola]|uniref:NmrA family NAD(P)-binding protein n=1 Tax=Streptomyces acidicola TaxID=2596892 RepID=UPI003820F597
MQAKIHLVLGATGNTGTWVTAGLRQRGVNVRARARSTSPRFDWHDETTWEPALSGVTDAYLVAAWAQDPSPDGDKKPGMARGGFAHEQMARFSRLAADSGVRHLVLLSGRTGLSGSHIVAPLEQAVRDSGTAWTILRPGTFAQNFTSQETREAIGAGCFQGFDVGGECEDFIDVADIAAVAVEILTSPGRQHEGMIYELSGPEALTTREAVAIIGRTLGRHIEYAEVSPDAWATQARAQGLDEESIDSFLTANRSVREGYFRPHDGVQRVLGREPRAFADFVLEAAASGAWGPVRPD